MWNIRFFCPKDDMSKAFDTAIQETSEQFANEEERDQASIAHDAALDMIQGYVFGANAEHVEVAMNGVAYDPDTGVMPTINLMVRVTKFAEPVADEPEKQA